MSAAKRVFGRVNLGPQISHSSMNVCFSWTSGFYKPIPNERMSLCLKKFSYRCKCICYSPLLITVIVIDKRTKEGKLSVVLMVSVSKNIQFANSFQRKKKSGTCMPFNDLGSPRNLYYIMLKLKEFCLFIFKKSVFFLKKFLKVITYEI